MAKAKRRAGTYVVCRLTSIARMSQSRLRKWLAQNIGVCLPATVVLCLSTAVDVATCSANANVDTGKFHGVQKLLVLGCSSLFYGHKSSV